MYNAFNDPILRQVEMTSASVTLVSVFRFGVFELDCPTGELRKAGMPIHLPHQPFRILALLASRPGQLVTREEIRQVIWGNETFVDFDQGLNHCIKQIRCALGDDSETPRYIETLRRRGYRFIYPVETAQQNTFTSAPEAVAAVSPPPIATAVRDRRYNARTRTLALAAGVVVATLGVLIALNVAGLRRRIVGAGPTLPADGEGKILPYRRIESIAVLPLEDLSRDPQQEYFADGMTDELITRLAQIRALRVISRGSVMQYKAKPRPTSEIARELNVDAVVEGTVLRSGNRVRITAQLIQADAERHLWAESYERDLRDVLSLQSEVARAVAERVSVALTPQEQVRLSAIAPVNPEAYEAYLRGTYALNRGAGGRTVIQYFRRAIAADPTYAQPYVGLGLAYIQMGFGSGPLSPREAFAQARQAALQALELDAMSAEARSCLAWVKAFGEQDWAGADRDFRRAIEISPSSVEAHQMYSWYLSSMGRHEEAIAESLRARRLDPVSPQASFTVASAFWWARQYERFAAESERLAEMDPTFLQAFQLQGLANLQAGSYEKAIRYFQRAIALREKDPPVWLVSLLGCAYGRAGRRAEALNVLKDLQSRSKHKYVSPYLIALVYANLGKKDEAFSWLEEAYAERNTMLAFLKVDGVIDPLRSDPRFQDLLRRMNYPQ